MQPTVNSHQILVRKSMFIRIVLALLTSFITPIVLAFDIGVSTSGKDISLDIWSANTEHSGWGAYMRGVSDFEDYQNGAEVTVCRDGSISGSTGSGTCSGHSGVSHRKLAEFSRLAIAVGPTYWINKSLQLHVGLIYGMYKSDIDIGEKSKLDYSESGVDAGLSFRPFAADLKFVLGHETEQKRTYLGIRFSI